MSGRRDALVIANVALDGRCVDVVVADGAIAAIPPAMDARRRDTDVIDGHGGAIVPGLHDHHLHLMAMAAARQSVAVGPPDVVDESALVDALCAADKALDRGRWLRAIGYHESVAGDLDRTALDRVVPDRPVRIQHRSGACWIVNSAAIAALDLDRGSAPGDGVERDDRGVPTGRLFGLDDWLGDRVPRVDLDLCGVARSLASFGVTGVTDATPTERVDELEVLARAAAESDFGVHVAVTGGPSLPLDASPSLRRGPVKLLLADHRLPDYDELVVAVRAARRHGRAVAVHCVTRAALVLALAVWEDVGVVDGDRIEHGAVVPVELVSRIAELGLTVVTQPRFIYERGDAYLGSVDADDREQLWRCGSLLAAGVRVAGSSDAPFGDADPWSAIASATSRQTRHGVVLGPGERLGSRAALDLYLAPLADPGGRVRRVEVGAPADLCVLDGSLADVLARPASSRVALTVARGVVTFRRTPR